MVERPMTRRGLGRGLDALLPTRGDEGLEEQSDLNTVAIDRIVANPNQPRKAFDPVELEELAASIRSLGVLQPLLVRRTGARFELIAGERRWRAAQLADLNEVPVLVVETDDRGVLERALVENLQRSDLNPVEEAAAYKQLIEDAGITQETLAQRVGRGRATIANSLRLLELPDGIQRYLIEGRLSGGHGKALLALQGNPLQARLAQRVATEGMSVRETEELVRRYGSMTGTVLTRSSGQSEKPASAIDAQRRLADRLQTRVRIDTGKRKGKIVIDFVSFDELERLVDTIVGQEDSK